MFGHNNNNPTDPGSNVQHGSDTPADGTVGSLEPETIAPTAGTAPVVADTTDDGAAPANYIVTDVPGTAPAAADDTTPPPANEPPAPAHMNTAPATPPVSAPAAHPAAANGAAANSDLLSLKQSALHELSPLLGHLDQTPEEKFRTTMMMIQAADDQSLLQAAYDAARSITDEKARAQALLDVVNEINYFTQASTTDAS